MGENEQSELIHYTIFFILILIMSTLSLSFIQISQVQTAQHNIESVLSKNGGYTNGSLAEIVGSDANLNTNNGLIPIKHANWLYLSKTAAIDDQAWTRLNNHPVTTNSGNTNHWNLDNGDTEKQYALIPYELEVRPLGAGTNSSNIVFGWFPTLKFSGVAQSQVYTGQVE